MKKYIYIGFVLVVLLIGSFVFDNARFNDGKLHLVFCNVGQGDGIFIRTPKGKDILVDAGPDNSILNCLSKHMPFWDKTIELAILTHPHSDHLNGFLGVFKNYKVLSFATENLKNNTSGFTALIESLKEQNIKIQYVYLGDRFIFNDGVDINIVGPSKDFLNKTSPEGLIGEKHEFANVESLVRYKDFSALLTGDSQASELEEALRLAPLAQGKISILQVPHHGSKTGLDDEFLDQTTPKLAVISVGKKNKYGHPTQETLKMLRDKDITILRTDENGEIEIVSDGDNFRVVK